MFVNIAPKYKQPNDQPLRHSQYSADLLMTLLNGAPAAVSTRQVSPSLQESHRVVVAYHRPYGLISPRSTIESVVLRATERGNVAYYDKQSAVCRL